MAGAIRAPRRDALAIRPPGRRIDDAAIPPAPLAGLCEIDTVVPRPGLRVRSRTFRGQEGDSAHPRPPAAACAVVLVAFPGEADAAWGGLHALAQSLRAGAVRPELVVSPEGRPEGLFLACATPDLGTLRAAILAVRDLLATQQPGALAAASTPIIEATRLPVARRQAGFALALLRAGLVRGPLVSWDDADALGPYRPLFPLWGAATTTDFVAETLGDLLRRDPRQAGDLVRTILAYGRHGGNVGGAAAELGIHRNTLTYRLRQVEAETGLTPYNPAHLLSLLLAALLWTLPEPPATRG